MSVQAIDKACDELTEQGVKYELIEHPAVYTMEEMENLSLFQEIHICKNLFLCDDKGRNHFLVVMDGTKKADIQQLAEFVGCKKLRFASEARLNKVLQLPKGAVTPLGIMNDELHQVTVLLDQNLEGYGRLGVHPNDNCATVILTYDDIKQIISHYGNPVLYFKS